MLQHDLVSLLERAALNIQSHDANGIVATVYQHNELPRLTVSGDQFTDLDV